MVQDKGLVVNAYITITVSNIRATNLIDSIDYPYFKRVIDFLIEEGEY